MGYDALTSKPLPVFSMGPGLRRGDPVGFARSCPTHGVIPAKAGIHAEAFGMH